MTRRRLDSAGEPSRQALSYGLVACALLWLFPSVAVGSSDGECGRWETGGERVGSVEHDALDEASGLAWSGRRDDLMWMHNDSGGGPNVFAVGREGTHRGMVTLPGVDAKDWEDIASGPCSSDGEAPCLYVADIGDNREARERVEIIVFEEVVPSPGERRAVTDYRRIVFEYPGGPRNAETLMVHPETADLFVVEKASGGQPRVYRIPRDPNGDADPYTVEAIARIDVSGPLGAPTAGAIAPDGRSFTVRSYVKIFTFCVPPGGPFHRAFASSPVESYPPVTFQSEALDYGPSGESVWFTSERRPTPIVRMERTDSGGKRSAE